MLENKIMGKVYSPKKNKKILQRNEKNLKKLLGNEK